MELKAIYEQRAGEEQQLLQEAEGRQQEALLEAAQAAEEARKALEELEKNEELSSEERQELEAKASQEQSLKEAAELKAKEAQEELKAAQQRALETEREMKDATINAHFQVLHKLSRVQASHAMLEDRLRMQEEMISAAERRATEAEEKEQRLCTLVSAKALARQVRQRECTAQTLLACEQEDEWRFTVGVDRELASEVRNETASLAAQYLATCREFEDLEEMGTPTLQALKDFVEASAKSRGLRFSRPASQEQHAKVESFDPPSRAVTISTQTDFPQLPGDGPVSRTATREELLGASPRRLRSDLGAESLREGELPTFVRQEDVPEFPPSWEPIEQVRARSKPGTEPQPEVPQLGPRVEPRLPAAAVGKLPDGGHEPQVVMTPSTSTASVLPTAMPSQMMESASSSTVQASQQLSTELREDVVAQPRMVMRRGSLEQLGLAGGRRPLVSPRSDQASSSKAATSKRLLHVNATGSVEQSLEAVQAELLEATADSEAEAKALAKERAFAAGRKAQGTREAVAMATEEVADPELRACVAGMAAAEAAYHQGASAEEALHTASHEAMAMAQKLPVELAQQCAALAQGAVIGRAAAMNSWTPSRAANSSADVLRRFVAKNDIPKQQLVAMTAMATHEAAETVALAQGLTFLEATLVGAEEASRCTEELQKQQLRGLALQAVHAAGGLGLERSATGPLAAKEPLPRLQHAATGLSASPRRAEKPSVRRLSISELTLPAMPHTARNSLRSTQVTPELEEVAPVANQQYPDASRIMNYGPCRPSEVDKRASSYLQQMQERRAKPKLQGWQRLRGEKPSERPRRARTPPDSESSPEPRRRRQSTFGEHLEAQKKVQKPAAVAPVPPPTLSMAAGRVMRSSMMKAREPPSASQALHDLVRAKMPGKLRKPAARPSQVPELRIDAEQRSASYRRSSLRHQPEGRRLNEPFAPDTNSLFIAGGDETSRSLSDREGESKGSRQASKASLSPGRKGERLEGKSFNNLTSPGSTVRSVELDPANVGEALSVSQLATENGSRHSFYKAQTSEDIRESRRLEEELMDPEPRGKSMGPTVVPMGPRKSEKDEAEGLVKRVCDGLQEKFGSVDAAFLSMSARMGRFERLQGETSEEEADRSLLQLRGCLVESGVGYKEATLLLQAMRCGLAGERPTLQHVANSLKPGQLRQDAIEMAKMKASFHFSGSDDPNINIESIRGFSNLDARSILERPGQVQAPGDPRSGSNSPSRSRSRSKAAA